MIMLLYFAIKMDGQVLIFFCLSANFSLLAPLFQWSLCWFCRPNCALLLCNSRVGYWRKRGKKRAKPMANCYFSVSFLFFFFSFVWLNQIVDAAQFTLYCALETLSNSEHKAKLLWSVSAKAPAKIHTSGFGHFDYDILRALLCVSSPSSRLNGVQIHTEWIEFRTQLTGISQKKNLNYRLWLKMFSFHLMLCI